MTVDELFEMYESAENELEKREIIKAILRKRPALKELMTQLLLNPENISVCEQIAKPRSSVLS